jgi:hypothetical protein
MTSFDEQLIEAQAQALARRPEFGKSAHLLPEDERKRIETRRDEILAAQERDEAESPPSPPDARTSL